jgi:type I restriction-modification system DNA methylase subunit
MSDSHKTTEHNLSKDVAAFVDTYAAFVRDAANTNAAVETANTYLFDRYAHAHLADYPQPVAPDGLHQLADLQIDFEDGLSPDTLGRRFDHVVAQLHSRASTGSFYTPEEMVRFCVKSTVRPRVRDRLVNLGVDTSDIDDVARPDAATLADACSRTQAEAAFFDLSSMSILDPSCGSGQFLVGAVDELAAIRRALADRAGLAVPDPAHVWQSCTQNVYGVDLVAETVEMAKLRLQLRGLRALPSDPPDADVAAIRKGHELHWQVRQGNALMGMTGLEDLENLDAAEAAETQHGQTTLLGGSWA